MKTEQTADDIAKAAYNGHEPDGLCDLTDLHLHTCLVQLYDDYKADKIDKQQAENMKKKLTAAWASDKDTLRRWEQMTSEYSDNIRKIATLHPEKAETASECIRILAQMVAALTGDSSLPSRLKNKFME